MKVCQLDGILFDKKKVVSGNKRNGAIHAVLNNGAVEIELQDIIPILSNGLIY